LIDTRAGYMEKVFDEVEGMDKVEKAAMLTGQHDIMAITRSEDMRELSDTMTENVKGIEGVKRIFNCLFIG